MVQLSSSRGMESETHVNAGFCRHLQFLRLLGNTDQYRSSGRDGMKLHQSNLKMPDNTYHFKNKLINGGP